MPEFDPIQELSQIKNQLNSLKEKISAKAAPAEIDKSFSELSTNLNKILGIFQHAADEIKKAPPEEADKLKDMIEEIEEENKSIAKGIVVLAEMIKDRLPEKPKFIPPKPTPQIRPIPQPKIIQPQMPHVQPSFAPPKPTPLPMGFPQQRPMPAPSMMPPPLRPTPTPVTQLRREGPFLEEMPPPPRPPPEMLGFPQPRKLPEERAEKGGLLGKIFSKK